MIKIDGNAENEVNATGKADAQNEILRFINKQRYDSISQVVLKYVKGEMSWGEAKSEMVVELPKERRSEKARSRWKEGPVPANRRENRKTKKWRQYTKVQQAWRNNKCVTIADIIDDKFCYEEEDIEYPPISKVDNVYINRLERSEKRDTAPEIEIVDIHDSDGYGRDLQRQR